MESFYAFLESQQFITLFLVLAIGYAVGKVNVAGLSLGTGAVLFVGLAIGALAPGAKPDGLLGVIGIALFAYCLGIAQASAFFRGFASPLGVKANALGALGVLVGCVVAVLLGDAMGVEMDFTVGMYAGSTTSTPSMQAAMAVTGNAKPAVAYAITYPIGVIVPILCAFLFSRLLKPPVELPVPARMQFAEARAADRGIDGLTVAQLLERVGGKLEILQIRRGDRNHPLDPEMVLEPDDIVSVAGLPDVIASYDFGDSEEARSDRRDLDYLRCFVSRTEFVGKTVGELALPDIHHGKIIQIRRGDVDLLPGSEVVLEFGDQVGVLVEPAGRAEIGQFFGDSVTAQASFSLVALGLGLVLGALAGLVPIPIPGVGTITLGMAGGPLLVGLSLGYFGRIGPLNFNMPVASNAVLCNFGLSLLLAVIGIGAGGPFAENVGAGLQFLLGGIFIAVVSMLVVVLVGLYLMRMRFDELLGIVAAITSPANLAYANELTPTGRPGVVYGMVLPGVGIILKVVAVQIMLAIATG